MIPLAVPAALGAAAFFVPGSFGILLGAGAAVAGLLRASEPSFEVSAEQLTAAVLPTKGSVWVQWQLPGDGETVNVSALQKFGVTDGPSIEVRALLYNGDPKPVIFAPVIRVASSTGKASTYQGAPIELQPLTSESVANGGLGGVPTQLYATVPITFPVSWLGTTAKVSIIVPTLAGDDVVGTQVFSLQ